MKVHVRPKERAAPAVPAAPAAPAVRAAVARPESRPWAASAAAYAAAAWALLFAASNVYWGLGGRQAVPLPDPEVAFADPTFRLINLVAIWGKAGMALVALATVWARGTGQTGLPRRLLLIVAYGLGIGMTLYGALGLAVDTLRLLGVLAVPPESWPSLRWHVFLWDPWWIGGGLLFLGTPRNLQASRAGARK